MATPDVFVILDDQGGRHLVGSEADVAEIPRLGVVEVARLRESLGRKVSIGSRSLLVLPASRRDRMEALARGPQTIGPKDAASLIFAADVSPDDVVVEAGAGSGWLTVALAAAVGPRGRVVAYDRRGDFAALAQENVRRAGMADRVEVRVADIARGIQEHDVDAVVLDLPEPWTVVPLAWDALRVGGSFASFSPTVEQVRSTWEALARHPFVDLRTLEVIERELEVRETGTRPSHAPIGHTGYLTTARKCLDRFRARVARAEPGHP